MKIISGRTGMKSRKSAATACRFSRIGRLFSVINNFVTDKPVAFSWLDWIWFSRFNIIRSGYCMKSELPGTLAQQRHKEAEHELFRKTKRPQNPCTHFCDFCFAVSDGFPGFCHSGNKNSLRRNGDSLQSPTARE